jgi:hypothetical protein
MTCAVVTVTCKKINCSLFNYRFIGPVIGISEEDMVLNLALKTRHWTDFMEVELAKLELQYCKSR